MRRRLIGLAVVTTLAFVSLLAVAQAGEENIPLDKVPKAVMDTVKAQFKGAEIVGASKEEENGATVFEVALKDKGRSIDATLTPEGELVSVEKEIAAKDLPKAVAAALDEKYPKATYRIVEEIVEFEKQQAKPAFYEILLVTADKKTVEVQLAPDGKIIAVEEKKGTEKDND